MFEDSVDNNQIRQFGRVCSLIVGKDGNGIEIKNLRIKFTITKSSSEDPNTAKIEVYNLNPDNQSQIIKEFADIQLIAGYKGGERLIFSGQIRTAVPTVSGTDRIMTIECGDGDREVLRGFINKSFEKGVTANEIVGECQEAMFGIKPAHQDSLPKTYSRGRTISGRASDVLTEQCNANDAQWSIQDGDMLILKDGSVRPNAVWLINQSTGMLGSPEPTTIGVKVKTLLNPAYLIGGVAKIDSLIFSGGVRIEKINHIGDTHGDEWASHLEGLSV